MFSPLCKFSLNCPIKSVQLSWICQPVPWNIQWMVFAQNLSFLLSSFAFFPTNHDPLVLFYDSYPKGIHCTQMPRRRLASTWGAELNYSVMREYLFDDLCEISCNFQTLYELSKVYPRYHRGHSWNFVNGFGVVKKWLFHERNQFNQMSEGSNDFEKSCQVTKNTTGSIGEILKKYVFHW